MRKRDIIKRLQEEGKDFVPDVRASIIDQLGLESQKSRRFSVMKHAFKPMVVLMTVFLFIMGIHLLNTHKPNPVPYVPASSYSFVTVSVNPSFEFEVDDENTIVSFRALNIDAIPILDELDIQKDSKLEVVLIDLIQVLEDTGYIEEGIAERQVNIQVVNEEPAKEERVIERIQKHMKHAMVSFNQPSASLRQEAKKYGVSPNKLWLAYQVIEHNPTLTITEALKLKINELNEILNGYQADEVNHFHEEYRNYFNKLEQAREKEKEKFTKRYQDARDRLEKIRGLIERGNGKDRDNLIRTWLEQHLELPEEIINDIIDNSVDNKRLIDQIEELLNARYNQIGEFIEMKHQIQQEMYKEHVRQGIKRGHRDIQFELEDNYRLEEILSGDYNEKEREVLFLLEIYQSLKQVIDNNNGNGCKRVKRQLEEIGLMIISQLNSEEIRDSIKERPEIDEIIKHYNQQQEDIGGNGHHHGRGDAHDRLNNHRSRHR